MKTDRNTHGQKSEWRVKERRLYRSLRALIHHLITSAACMCVFTRFLAVCLRVCVLCAAHERVASRQTLLFACKCFLCRIYCRHPSQKVPAVLGPANNNLHTHQHQPTTTTRNQVSAGNLEILGRRLIRARKRCEDEDCQ